MRNIFLPISLVAGISLMAVSSAFAIPYCSQTEQVNCAEYGLGGKDCHQTETVGRTQCVDLSTKGMEVVQAFERRAQPAQRQVQDQCPSGFQPSENKCSNEERRRGCKDMRLPSGLGCVHR